jgi:hypothetical protein
LQFFGGYSPQSTTVFGTARDRRFVLAGFAYSYRCREWGGTSLNYTGALMPAAVVIQPDGHGVYGFAAAPLGATLEFARTRRIHPFAETLLGIIASAEPVPVRAANATGLNFMFDIGGGIRMGRAVTVGYKFLHVSNASTTSFNPGLDNNVIYVGYSFIR